MDSLTEARKVINEVDEKMAELFMQRMSASKMVAEYKREHGLPILDQKREDELIEQNCQYIKDEQLKSFYISFLRDIMKTSRAYQHMLVSGAKIAYSGVEGAFAHIAAGRIFSEGNCISCRDFKAAYDSVVSGENDVAVLPIENSYAGEVGQTIDLIFSGTLFINGIYELEIRQNLLGVPGATVEDVKKVISHPQALSQCHDYIELRKLETEEANNTAFAFSHYVRLCSINNLEDLDNIIEHLPINLQICQIILKFILYHIDQQLKKCLEIYLIN